MQKLWLFANQLPPVEGDSGNIVPQNPLVDQFPMKRFFSIKNI